MKRRHFLLSFFKLDAYSDKSINVAVFILLILGTLTIVSTNVGKTTTYSTSIVYNVILKQCAFIIAGYFVMLFMNKVFQFKWYSAIENLIIVIALFILTLPFGFKEIGGSRAWIQIAGISLQPSEFAKPLIMIVAATCLYRAKKETKLLEKKGRLFRKLWITYILIAGIVLLQKDTGTLVIISFIFFACLMIPKYPVLAKMQRILKILLLLGIVAAVGLFGVTDIGTQILKYTPFAHIATRVENFKDPYTDVYGNGYQPANSLYGIASSNIFGKGIGNSARKYGYLTQADNDYILAVLIEETGIFGLGLLVILYCVLIGKIFYYAFKTSEVMYKVILGGSATYIFMHFFLNAGGVASLIPFTGVPLLFISSGGTSLMSIMMTMGLCQNCISKIRKKEMNVDENRSW